MAGKEAAKTSLHEGEEQQSFPLLSNSSQSSKLSLSFHGAARESVSDDADEQSRLRGACSYPEPDSSEITSTSTSVYSDTTDGDFHREINPRHWEYGTSSFSYNNSRTSLIGNIPQSQGTTTHGHGREYGAISAPCSAHGRAPGASQSQSKVPTTTPHGLGRTPNSRSVPGLSQSSRLASTACSQGRENRTASFSLNQNRATTTQGREHGVVSTSQSHNIAHASILQSQDYSSAPHSQVRGEEGAESESPEREYGTVGGQPQSISENTVCLSNKLKKEQAAIKLGDRRNEFFTLKRFIFMTLGMPDTPAITPKMQRISTCLAIPFYLSLFVWGIAIFVVAIQSDGWIWTGRCPAVIPAKVLTMLAGTFFILLGLYWLYVLRWSRAGVDTLPHRSFSAIALLWWTLCMYFFGIAAALATEVFENSHLVASLGNATDEAHPSMSVLCVGTEEYLEVPNNLVPLWALTSMVLLWVLYIGVFVVATISIYSVQ